VEADGGSVRPERHEVEAVCFKFWSVIRKNRASNRTVPGPITIAIWSGEGLAK
jgi:hypothetical protein